MPNFIPASLKVYRNILPYPLEKLDTNDRDLAFTILRVFHFQKNPNAVPIFRAYDIISCKNWKYG